MQSTLNGNGRMLIIGIEWRLCDRLRFIIDNDLVSDIAFVIHGLV
ncbi:hypothetical protein O9929_07480 [Vibrio lentus]|nr:hypothetical protein [Vibrio lentus]